MVPKTDNRPVYASISTSTSHGTSPQSKGEYDYQTVYCTQEQSSESDASISSSLKMLASVYSSSSDESSEEGEIFKRLNKNIEIVRGWWGSDDCQN